MRGKGRPFEKGVCPNPAGRPKQTDFPLKAECQKLVPKVLAFFQEVMDDPTAKREHKIKISEMLMDRGFGKALQPTKDVGQGESWKEFWSNV